MATADLRNNIVGLIRTLASKDEQLAYELNVPVANVPAELVCMWFDDLYHPDADSFLECFTPAERERLAKFHAFFDARLERLPDTLAEVHQNAAWLEVMSEAQQVIDELGWTAGG